MTEGRSSRSIKAIPTLREYLVIEQNRVAVDHFQAQGAAWPSTSYTTLAATVALLSVPAQLPLREIYRDVFDPL